MSPLFGNAEGQEQNTLADRCPSCKVNGGADFSISARLLDEVALSLVGRMLVSAEHASIAEDLAHRVVVATHDAISDFFSDC